jgi:hypothetical protein
MVRSSDSATHPLRLHRLTSLYRGHGCLGATALVQTTDQTTFLLHLHDITEPDEAKRQVTQLAERYRDLRV